MQNKMLNSDMGVSGIFRAKLINHESKIRVYVPGIHSMNPFNEEGVLKDDCKNNIKMFPIAQWCCYLPNQIVEEVKDDKIYWVMFENGDFKRPIVISYDKENDREFSITGTTTGLSVPQLPKSTQIPRSSDGLIYPLACKYTADPFSGGRQFGASRNNGRSHAGIDLLVPNGTAIYAMQDCTIKEINTGFYDGTNAIIVKNADDTWYLYGECQQCVTAGTTVTQGTAIGTVKQHSGGSMLHFEAYNGDYDSHVLSNNGDYMYVESKTYKRRADLVDPSFVVDLYES